MDRRSENGDCGSENGTRGPSDFRHPPSDFLAPRSPHGLDFLIVSLGPLVVVVGEEVVSLAVAEDVFVVEGEFDAAAVNVAVVLDLVDALDALALGLVVLGVPTFPGGELFVADAVVHFAAAADLGHGVLVFFLNEEAAQLHHLVPPAGLHLEGAGDGHELGTEAGEIGLGRGDDAIGEDHPQAGDEVAIVHGLAAGEVQRDLLAHADALFLIGEGDDVDLGADVFHIHPGGGGVLAPGLLGLGIADVLDEADVADLAVVLPDEADEPGAEVVRRRGAGGREGAALGNGVGEGHGGDVGDLLMPRAGDLEVELGGVRAIGGPLDVAAEVPILRDEHAVGNDAAHGDVPQLDALEAQCAGIEGGRGRARGGRGG